MPSHFEELWREAVTELVALLDAEFPGEARAGGASPPKASGGGRARLPPLAKHPCVAALQKPADWAGLYVAYVQTLRKLCVAHDSVAHPQKRRCLRRTLDACMGRALELRSFLEQLNQGLDAIDFGEQLAAAGLAPDALELPVPSYFREDRAARLAACSAAHASALAPLLGQGVGPAAVLPATAEADVPSPAAAENAAPAVAEQAAQASDVGQAQVMPTTQQPQASQKAAEPPPLAAQEAGGTTEVGEEDVEAQDRRTKAAVAVQACVRGWLARQRIQQQRRQELELLGMLPPADCCSGAALRQRAANILAQRKERQAALQGELERALVATKEMLRQQEGPGMREQMRDQLSNWFLQSRDPESGEYAELPEAAQGGSRSILKPPPPGLPSEEAAAAAKASRGAAASPARPGTAVSGRPARGGREVPALDPAGCRRCLAGLREALQEYMDAWQEHQPADSILALLPPELQGLPPPRAGSGADGHDAALVEEEVRPVVWEEVRLEADEEMRGLIRRVKDAIKAGRAEHAKKAGGKGKKGSKEGAKAAKQPGAATAAKGGKAAEAGGKGAAGGQPVPRRRKDPTAGRSIESIYAELAAAGLVHAAPPATVASFLGDQTGDQAGEAAPPSGPQPGKPRTGGRKANVAPAAKPAAGGECSPCPEPSLAQARQATVAACILPLGAHPALGMLDTPRCVLLYGPSGSGKTLLARAVAHQAGATLLDLSPAATAGKYPGKEAALMVHMVFKAARALAPAVVLVEGVEQVFMSDRARAALATPPGGEPPSRVRRALLAEVAELQPSDGVLVLCTSSAPQACVRRDERALRTFVQQYIQLPLPGSCDRHSMLRAFAREEGLPLGEMATVLAQLTDGLSAGQLRELIKQLAARLGAVACHVSSGSAGTAGQGMAGVTEPAAAAIREAALELLPSFAPLSREAAQELREWGAQVRQPLEPEEEDEKAQKRN